MAERKDGGPAFPGKRFEQFDGVNADAHHQEVTYSGLSIRDWFAGQAMQSLVLFIGIPEEGSDELWDNETAQRAYAMADAMIAARENPNG